MAEFAKSLIIEFIVAVIISIVSPFIPYLTEFRISLAYTIIIVTIIAFAISVLYHFQIQQMKKSKSSRIGARKFSCVKCGELFEASPPDDVFTIANLFPQSVAIKTVEIDYECVNHHKTTIYWTAPPTPARFFISNHRPT